MSPKANSYIKRIVIFALMVAIITFMTVLLKNFLLHLEMPAEVSRVIALVAVFSGYYAAFKWLNREIKKIEGS